MLETQPKLSFAAFVKGRSPSAVSLKVPYGVMEAMDTMDEIDADDLRDLMREKYATRWDFEAPESDSTEDAEFSDSEGNEHKNPTTEKLKSAQITSRQGEKNEKLQKPEETKMLGKPDPANPDTPDTDPSDQF